MKYNDVNWQDRFEIKESSKENAGRGVFVKTNIKKGEHIGYYTGKVLNAKQIQREPYVSSSYLVQVTHNYFILGEGKGINFVSFINHCSKPNAELVVSNRWKTARIVALKKLKKARKYIIIIQMSIGKILEKRRNRLELSFSEIKKNIKTNK